MENLITKNKNSLYSRQIALFSIAFLPVTKFFTLPSRLSGIAGNDMWFSVLISLILDLLLISVYTIVFRNETRDIFTLLTDYFGKTVKTIYLILLLTLFMLKAILPVLEIKQYIELTLYSSMPKTIYFLPFFICPIFLSLKKIRVLGRLSDVLFIVTIIALLLLFFLALSNMDFTALLPMFHTSPKNIFEASRLSTVWISDSLYFLFFIGNTKKQKKNCLKIILGYVGAMVIILIFMVSFYAIFDSIAFRQRFALTETSKYSSVINNLGRFDYIAIVNFLFTGIFALSLPLYFSSLILQNILNGKKYVSASIPALMVLIISFFKSYYNEIENIITQIYPYFYLIFGYALNLILCLLYLKRRKNEKSN